MSNQISSERFFSGSSSFSRTILLPRPVDGNNVVAKLKDGILTLTIPKAEDRGSVKVAVE
jgi:HSP20 family molecular chaperone IbpA